MDQKMAEVDPISFGQQRHQIALDFDWVFFLGQAQTATESRHMRIDDNAGRQAVSRAKYDVCRFSSNARQRDQGVQILGNFAAVMRSNRRTTGADVLGFIPKKASASNQSLKFHNIRGGILGGRPILGEQGRSDEVNPLVGTLSRENGGNQQFQRIAVLQSTNGVRVGRPKHFYQPPSMALLIRRGEHLERTLGHIVRSSVISWQRPRFSD